MAMGEGGVGGVDVLAVIGRACTTLNDEGLFNPGDDLSKARRVVTELIDAAQDMATAVSEETQALREFTGADGAGMNACKSSESRVIECTERLNTALLAARGRS